MMMPNVVALFLTKKNGFKVAPILRLGLVIGGLLTLDLAVLNRDVHRHIEQSLAYVTHLENSSFDASSDQGPISFLPSASQEAQGGEEESLGSDEISIIDQELFTDGVQGVGKDTSTLAKMKNRFDLIYQNLVNRNGWFADLEPSSESIPTFIPVSVYNMTSGFGIRKSPFSHRKRLHRGIDLRASYGSAVYASAAGRVISTAYHRSYGRMVIIDHGNGLETRYAHNSKITVKEGDQVQKGQLISKIGMTGRTTGPHLHFEIWLHGKPVNPLQFIEIPSHQMSREALVNDKNSRPESLDFERIDEDHAE